MSIVRFTQILYKAQSAWQITRSMDIPIVYEEGGYVGVFPPFIYSNRCYDDKKSLPAFYFGNIRDKQPDRNCLRVHEQWEKFPFLFRDNKIESISNPKPCWVSSRYTGYLPQPPSLGPRTGGSPNAIHPDSISEHSLIL